MINRHLGVALFLLFPFTAVTSRLAHGDPATPTVSADNVAGEWQAKGADPGWNGRFVLHLVLQQTGDSVYGTYQFDVDQAAVIPPGDVAGHVRDGKLELQDKPDNFWLTARLRGSHLDGRLAGGSTKKASAIAISFERVSR